MGLNLAVTDLGKKLNRLNKRKKSPSFIFISFVSNSGGPLFIEKNTKKPRVWPLSVKEKERKKT